MGQVVSRSVSQSDTWLKLLIDSGDWRVHWMTHSSFLIDNKHYGQSETIDNRRIYNSKLSSFCLVEQPFSVNINYQEIMLACQGEERGYLALTKEHLGLNYQTFLCLVR